MRATRGIVSIVTLVAITLLLTSIALATQTYSYGSETRTVHCAWFTSANNGLELYKAIIAQPHCASVEAHATCQPLTQSVLVTWKDNGRNTYAIYHASQKCETTSGTFVF